MENPIQLTLLHSERPKLYAFLAFLSAVGLNIFRTGKELHIHVIIVVFIKSPKHVINLFKKDLYNHRNFVSVSLKFL